MFYSLQSSSSTSWAYKSKCRLLQSARPLHTQISVWLEISTLQTWSEQARERGEPQKVLHERKELYSTHVWLQHAGHFNAILRLVGLQNAANCPLSCSQRGVQHMNELLFILPWLGLTVTLRFVHTSVLKSDRIAQAFILWALDEIQSHEALGYIIEMKQKFTVFCP